MKTSNIIIYCRDKTARTIKTVISRVKEYINSVSDLPDAKERYRLAGGYVGVQAAINETLAEYPALLPMEEETEMPGAAVGGNGH